MLAYACVCKGVCENECVCEGWKSLFLQYWLKYEALFSIAPVNTNKQVCTEAYNKVSIKNQDSCLKRLSVITT